MSAHDSQPMRVGTRDFVFNKPGWWSCYDSTGMWTLGVEGSGLWWCEFRDHMGYGYDPAEAYSALISKLRVEADKLREAIAAEVAA